MPAPTCYSHAGVEAVASCHGCMRPICRACTLMEGSLEFCPACAAGHRKRQGAARLGLGLVLLAVVGGGAGGIGWLATRPRPPPPAKPAPPPPPKYGAFTNRIEQAKKKLEEEPCDRKVVLKLTEFLLKGEAPREVIGVVDAFAAKCGPHERLVWDKYTAHKRLSEYGAAVDAATTLMELNPMDFDYPWWRAEMLEAQGKHEEAIVDYRLTLQLLPKAKSIPLHLTDALFKVGRPCEAAAPLDLLLYFHPEQRASSEVGARLARLEEAKCELGAGEGKASFKAPPGAPAFRARVKVNDKATGNFIVDTGATTVALSKSFAEKAGVGAEGLEVKVRTAAGVRVARLASLAKVETQGAKARNVEAAVIDDFGEDGLLGLSFLSRFELQMDPKTRTLTLKSRPKLP